MEKLTTAVLGAGRIGAIHATNIAAHTDATLVAVADVDASAAKRTAGETGARVASIDAILSDHGIRAVVICTPTDTHADLIMRAAAAGKAIFCEKPVDLDITRIQACLAEVDRAQVPLMIGFNRRFDPSFADLARRLRSDQAGAIELISIVSRDPTPPPAAYVARSGGLFRDMMIHDFDMARFLMAEEFVEVFAYGSALIDRQIGQAGDVDTAVCILKTATGRIAQISNSRRTSYGYDQRIEVHGSLGLLAAGNRTATTVTRATADGFATDSALPFFLERYAEAYRLELGMFVRAVLDGQAIAPNGRDGFAAARLADAATLSCKSGRPIPLTPGQ
jgi:myo-inositol 2-dehydrogenase / D-chiro-inositol 1-dehydrogenase